MEGVSAYWPSTSSTVERSETAPVAAQLVAPKQWLLWTTLLPTMSLGTTLAVCGCVCFREWIREWRSRGAGGCLEALVVGFAAGVAVRRQQLPRRVGPDAPSVAVIGCGFSGLNMAVQLKRRGYRFKVFERSSGLGGVWERNRYPGVACDIFSHLYSFSYAPNPNWSRSFARGDEIRSYLERVARAYNILPSKELHVSTELVEASWDEDRCQWLVTTRRVADSGEPLPSPVEEYFDVLVPAVGLFPVASLPDVEGLATFGGPVTHSAAWDPTFDARGKTVAIVGTGASAVQLVPRLAQQAERLVVLQRTPGWIIPKQDFLYPAWLQMVFKWMPWTMSLHRLCFWLQIELFATLVFIPPTDRDGKPCMLNAAIGEALKAFVRWQVRSCGGSPELAERLMPAGAFGNTRPALSLDWFPALCKPNVTLVSCGMDRLEPGVVVAGGTRYPVDACVFATGFAMRPHPTSQQIRGIGGRQLAEAWVKPDEEGSFLGMVSPNFPNLYQLYGPGSQGYNNLVTQAEIQASYVLSGLRAMEKMKLRRLSIRNDVAADYLAERSIRLANSVHFTAKRSYYLACSSGRNALWMQHPGNQVEYWWRARQMDLNAYDRR